MGRFINIGNTGFERARNGEYVDKSKLIGYVNRSLNTEHNMLCVTRARRFGKSMAAKMLCAYYDQSCDSKALFNDLAIAQDSTFETHLNKYPVIYLDLTDFTTQYSDDLSDIVKVMQGAIIQEVEQEYPDVRFNASDDLMSCLLNIATSTGKKFIMIIDEWDAICREADKNPDLMRRYVDWLRRLFKGGNTDRVFAGVYMTGILPIIQYDTQSALNNFEELTMISPGALAGHFGFTKDEVANLCEKYGLDIEQMTSWYDGYQLGETQHIYNPYSVMSAIRKHSIESYWATTGAYESLRKYIMLNFDGLRESVIELLSGNEVNVNVLRFSNNLQKIISRDDALTTLIHLGYLSYDRQRKTCSIPNYEVKQEFEKSVRDTDWKSVTDALEQSEALLNQTLEGDENAVTQAIEAVHEEFTSVLQYNNENSLSCVITIAYYMAQNQYVFVREFPTGKGFADVVLIPKQNIDMPAIIIELKWNESADTAINQIKQKGYVKSLAKYTGEVVLVGVNYDKASKKHSCKIESYVLK